MSETVILHCGLGLSDLDLRVEDEGPPGRDLTLCSPEHNVAMPAQHGMTSDSPHAKPKS